MTNEIEQQAASILAAIRASMTEQGFFDMDEVKRASGIDYVGPALASLKSQGYAISKQRGDFGGWRWNNYYAFPAPAPLGFSSFFAAVAQVASERVAAKKAAAEAKKQSCLTIIGRAQFKATGTVLFGVEDRRGKAPVIMHLTMIDGRITSCVNAATGESCSGHHWSGHCCHETRVLAYESERAEQLHEAAIVAPLVLSESFAEDLPAHVEDEVRTQAQREAEQEAYRNAFPGDFGYYEDVA